MNKRLLLHCIVTYLIIISGAGYSSEKPDDLKFTALVITHFKNNDNQKDRVTKNLSALLQPHGIKPHFTNIDKFRYDKNTESFDLIVIAGSSIAIKRHEVFEERKLILKTRKPIFGICYGFQQIIRAYGGNIRKHSQKLYGRCKIDFSPSSLFPFPAGQLNVFESHSWLVEKVPDEFEIIAEGQEPYRVEAVAHKSRPIVGVQFHPEIMKDNDGKIVFAAFVKNYLAGKLASGK